MKNEVYIRHIKNQSIHWWFQARKKIIESIIKKKIKKKISILDYGSGSGVNIKMLSKFGFVNIYEPHQSTNTYLKSKYKNKNKFKVLSKIKNQKFDLIILADVLEHIKGDLKTIKKLSKNLNKNGHILITVPAYKFLFSKKDIILGHYRRYNVRELVRIFENFSIQKLSYFNFFLFVPISILIFFFKIFKINFIDDVEKTPNFFLNKMMYAIFLIERTILNFFNFPFGISIIGLFKKND